MPGFVQYGTAGASISGATLNVTQSSSKAVLNWADFNIANGYTVNFLQPSATAAVLNNIWSADASVIAGHLNANGQVYLYNQNGIVFDKGAQINVAGLTASTLNFAPVAGSTDPDALFENGILSQNTGQTVPAVYSAAAPGSGSTAAITPGTITVNSGASLVATDGGRILLLGSAVTNSGAISAPDGQVILGAAGRAVYLAASSNPDMRGLLIEVDATGAPGTVINNGQISVPRGNITLAGLMVNQQGVLSATTSVGANGSIYLVAGDTSGGDTYYNPNPVDSTDKATAFGGLLPNNGGTLVLAPGSVTEVLPDVTDTGTLNVVQQSNFIPSQVELTGRVIGLDGNATIRAPDGTVNAYATANPYNLVTLGTFQNRLADGGSVYLDASSTIDVSGVTNVQVPVTQNLVQVTLETNDLQNDPLLRDGFLHGQAVTVDVNHPPALFDVTPYADNIGSNIQQLSTKGGTVNLIATGELIARAGSTLNVSGGDVAYQGGLGPSTTNLVAANGRVYNIATAPSTIQYVGIANNYAYTDPTWGVTSKGGGQSYYSGYTQGASAGTLDLQSPQVDLQGSMQAATTNGIYQRTSATLTPGGTFILGCGNCRNAATGLLDYGVEGGVKFATSLSDNLVGDVVADGYVVGSGNVPATTMLSPTQLTEGGFTSFEVSSMGPVLLPAGVNVSLARSGSFTVNSADSISIDGNLRLPGGQVDLVTPSTADLLPHSITLGTASVIDVSGNWTNDSPSVTPLPGTAPVVLVGGKVTMSAAGDVSLGFDSRIDVSGGGWVSQTNQLSTGAAGTIALSAAFSSNPSSAAEDPFTGTVTLGAGTQLLGGSLKTGGGGTLSLQSGSVTVGTISAGTPGELLLAPQFLTAGGFAQYNLSAQNDIVIGNPQDATYATQVNIAPIEQTLEFTKNAMLQPTGSSLADFTQLQTLPAPLRAAASISFTTNVSEAEHNASIADVGDITLARDAAITTDPGGSVALAANGFNGDLRVLGSITAPAGNITLQLSDPQKPVQSGTDPGFIANQQIELGPDAVLSAPAYGLVSTLNSLGYRQGSVLSGGTISLEANKGFVVTDLGSVIDVHGTATLLDVTSSSGTTPTVVAGNAGTINIAAREGIVLQGSLNGSAASLSGAPVQGAEGGTLNVALGPNYSNSGSTGTSELNPGSPIGGSIFYPTGTRILTLSSDPQSQIFNTQTSGTAILSVPALMAGGFDNISLSSADTIAFAGAVTLKAAASLTLDAPLMLGNPGAQVSLMAPYVALGNYNNNLSYFGDAGCSGCYQNPNAAVVLAPTTGDANLYVGAQDIDLRGISGWSGFATENLMSSGDIRFVDGANSIEVPPALNVATDPLFVGNNIFEGAFNTDATLNLQAAQIYPTTATSFAINDLPLTGAQATANAATTVSIRPASNASAAPAIPLSAGGSLSINATNINQYGVVRAPQGQIALNGVDISAGGQVVTPGSVVLADGSITSVAEGNLIIPFGSTANGTQWTYSPAVGNTDVLSQPLAKQISLNASAISVNSGATLDLSGGGDLYAYEFIAGQGGSVDVLSQASLTSPNRAATTTVYSYAILPTLGSQFAPLDLQYAQNSAVPKNTTIYLSGVPGLATGTYALLPADYALLPGAFAIQVVQSNSGIAQGSVIPQPAGGYEVAARFGVAGTSILSSLTSTVLVASDATVRTQSQYTDSYANEFFTAQAAAGATAVPRLPADAGQLLLAATDSLTLNNPVMFATGSFTSGTSPDGTAIVQQGRGGDVAISAENILVADAGTVAQAPAEDTLQLNVEQLNGLGTQTLILGASTTSTANGLQLNVGTAEGGTTQTVELKNTTALVAPEIILAAQDTVTIDSNAAISTSGGAETAKAPTDVLLMPGGGALLRVASGAQETLSIDPTTLPQTGALGTVSLGAGANVQGSGSLLLYGTHDTTLAAGAQIAAPAVALYSSAINLGDAPVGSSGLTVSTQLLNTFKGLSDLTLGSSSNINFYGPVQLGTPGSNSPNLNSISLDSAALVGFGAGDKTLQAGTVSWINSSGVAANQIGAGDGSGALQLIATGSNIVSAANVATASNAPVPGQLILGAGSKILSGFTTIDLQANGDIQGQGVGTLTVAPAVAAPLNLTAAAIVGQAGSSQTFSTSGAVTIIPGSGNPTVTQPMPGAGASLTIQGGSIEQDGTINLPSGVLSLVATAGEVTLGSGSLTAAAGVGHNYSVANAVSPGGQIDLTAQAGNVTLARGATVDVSGASLGTASGDAGSLTVAAPAGTFAFAGSTLLGGAPQGQMPGSFNLDVGSGLGGGSLGALTAQLGSGGFLGDLQFRTRTDSDVSIAGSVRASSFGLSVDQGEITVAQAGVINTSGSSAGVDGGSISLLAVNGVTLDAGAHLLANAGPSGPIGTNGAPLASHGGDILLATTAGTVRIDGGNAAQPTTISLQGSGGADTDGQLTLRALRTADNTGIQISILNAPSLLLTSRQPIIAEGFKTYSATLLGGADTVSANGCAGSCDVADMAGALFTQSQGFLANTSNIIATDLGGLANVEVRPGIEVDSTGDLTVGDATTTFWDLASWHAALGAPVDVTLRADGNLIFNAALSDGFTATQNAAGKTNPVAMWAFGEPGKGTDSASYTLTGGADLTAANPLAVMAQPATAFSLTTAANGAANAPPNSGDVIVAPGTLIRTGTGSIQIASGGDVLLNYKVGDAQGNVYDNGVLQVKEVDPMTAAVYTAGMPSLLTAAQAVEFTPPGLPAAQSVAGGQVSYAAGGGNISISAADDIRSAPSAQLISDWLWRDSTLTGQGTTWWVMFNLFQQGVGALGGGNISASAGHSIVNLSTVIPTTARLLGDGLLPSDLLLAGGGNLRVRAGSDIAGGVFEDDWGRASINAGGAFTSSADSTFGQETAAINLGAISGFSPPAPSTEIYPILALGNGAFSIAADQGIELGGVTNATTLPMTLANEHFVLSVGGDTAYYPYAQTSNPGTLNLTSAGGTVILDAGSLSDLPIVQLSAARSTYAPEPNYQSFLSVFPTTLNVASLSGDIELGTPKSLEAVEVDLFPSSMGNLNLLAAGSIKNDGDPFAINVSEADPVRAPNIFAQQSGLSFVGLTGAPLPQQPLHQTDTQPISIVAQSGALDSGTVILPKAANVVAGGNITDLTVMAKNLNPSDVTLIAAGGDIDYSTPTQAVTNALTLNPAGVNVAGPGFLEVLAGGSINLGDAQGIVTSGSLSDTRLPTTGATLIAGAGWGTNADGSLRLADYQAFTNAYLAPAANGTAGTYASALVNYMQQLYPAAASSDYPTALRAFEALTPAQQLPLLSQVLTDELSATGLAHSQQGTDYSRGYNAISTLFPAKDASGVALAYAGNINMFYSQLKSEQGGDIDLLVPGGSVTVGVANPPASLETVKETINLTGLPTPAAVNLGILVLGEGSIQGYADQNFTVNQSRILTLEGGDIILWASNGNIDAGKGAKSASGAPPPVIQTDANGNLFVNPGNAVSGSGIGQLLTRPGIKPGLVNLIAPKGAVNAGDAGIRVAGNLNIAAVQVIGASNITVTGTTSGVPVSQAGSFAGALSGANSLGDASKSAVDQLTQDLGPSTTYQALTDSLVPTFISVKMFCLGIECEEN